MALLTIGGVAMPTPTEMTVNVMDLSKADRNANGTMLLWNALLPNKNYNVNGSPL